MINSRDQYKIIFDKIKQIIVENDPPALIRGGAPLDEYDSIINKVISRIQNLGEEKKIAETIYSVFRIDLGENIGNKNQYFEIARKIKQFFPDGI